MYEHLPSPKYFLYKIKPLGKKMKTTSSIKINKCYIKNNQCGYNTSCSVLIIKVFLTSKIEHVQCFRIKNLYKFLNV